jgi:endonuclease/exonuclease/phosphatase (EEP) superfamily protein YafD
VAESPDIETTPRKSGTAGDWIKQFVIRRAIALSVFLAIVMVLSWAARWYWILDLLTHFPVQMAVAAFVPLAILLGLRRWKAAALPLLILFVSVLQVSPLYFPAGQTSGTGPVVYAVSANVHRSSGDRTRMLDYIRTCKPDFFVVIEIDDPWLTDLNRLADEYPYSVAQPRDGAFGIGLFSRVPIEDHEIMMSVAADVPMIRANLVFGDHRLAVIGVHLLPPVGRSRSEARNGQLREIADLAATIPGPKVLLGDLNVTSWSPHFADLIRRSEMRDGRKGFGVQPSWPDLPWVFQIPIDHTLVSDDIAIVARRVGPNVGSDHRPVEIEFQIGE